MNRDNFTKRTIEILAKRVGYHCSNPSCKKETVGPSSVPNKSISIGVAAHITAASEGGPRYDEKLSSEQRKHIDNAIWLCQSCSVLIDRDTIKYTAHLLRNWKGHSEKLAISKLESRNDFIKYEDNNNEAYSYINFVSFINSKEDGLICKINHEKLKESICFNYIPLNEEWKSEDSELEWRSPYIITLNDFATRTNDYLKEDKIESAQLLIDNVKRAIKRNGIRGLIEYLFNSKNEQYGIPPFENFIKAFEIFSNGTSNDYIPIPIGYCIYMNNREKEYEIDTVIGRTKNLNEFFSNENFEEIYTMTDNSIWEQVLVDPGIEKEVFIPELLEKWEDYWDTLASKSEYSETELHELREKSWRRFQLFADGYNSTDEILGYAFALDVEVLYPLAVKNMLSIYGQDFCFDEYCQFEFDEGWGFMSLDNYVDDINTFYIKRKEE